jgi:phage baseplate assembly protein W
MIPPDGRHLSFPFRIGPEGRTATVSSLEDHVYGEVIQLLLTNPGERPFLPDFGGGLRRLVFEGGGQTTEAMAKAMISQALSRWLDQRVTLQELTVTSQDGSLIIDLVYRVVGVDDARRLRFERKGG